MVSALSMFSAGPRGRSSRPKLPEIESLDMYLARPRASQVSKLAVLGVTCSLLFAQSAKAAEGELALGVQAVGGGSLSVETAVLGAEVELLVGLDDFVWVRGSTALAWSEPLSGVEAWVGGVWAADVLTYVPWVEASVGLVGYPDEGAFPAGRLSLGLDYVLDFEWSAGGFVRATAQPEPPLGAVVQGGLRLIYRWEP